MKASLLVLSSIFFALVAIAQPELSPAGAEKIKILSWNIYMLPGFLSPGKVPRAQALSAQLAESDYDVIVFQEAFHQKSSELISRILSPAFPFQAGPANQNKLSLKLNSGIWIFSRHPIINIHSIDFESKYGVDALSRKGALMVEINLNGNPVQIIGTHLQNAGDDWRKQQQCEELYLRLLRKYQQPGVPQIVCGDFNIHRNTDSKDYQLMLDHLDATDGELTGDRHFSYDYVDNDMQARSSGERNLIDYILLRSNEAFIVSSYRKIKVFQKQWASSHKDLSDHYSLETEVFYQSRPPLYTAGKD